MPIRCSRISALKLTGAAWTVVPFIDIVEENSARFYIRAQRCGELSNKVKDMKEWKTVRIGLFDVEVCSIDYTPFGGEKTYRYVVGRQKNNTGQTDAFFVSVPPTTSSIVG